MPVMLRADRRAMSLLELLVGLVIATLVVILASASLVRAQRSHVAVLAAADMSARLRDAADVITSDLRAISPVGDSVLVASDTAVEVYSALGASVACARSGASQISLPPDILPSGRILTSWISAPDTGDYVAVYSDSASGAGGFWFRAKVAAFTERPVLDVCPPQLGLLTGSDIASGSRGYLIDTTQPVPAGVHRGSPVRLVRRVRYSVYRGGDGKWYLGYRRCGSACAAIQPVSGPYDSRTVRPITIRYFARSGASLTGTGPTSDVARIEVVVRATYNPPFRLPGMRAAIDGDSVVAVIALRNQ